MNKVKSDFNTYKLLIVPKMISKSERYFRIFKPKEIIASQPCEIRFEIKNIGKNEFPGGKIQKLHVRYHSGEMSEHEYNRDIPKIPVEKSIQTLPLEKVLISNGTVWFLMILSSSDGKKINYYQLDKATNNYNFHDSKLWSDFIFVYSEQEMHHRYLTYISILLASITILITMIILILGLIEFWS